jgi:hypothetical protein
MIDRVGFSIDLHKMIIGILTYGNFTNLNLESTGYFEKGTVKSFRVEYTDDDDVYSYFIEIVIEGKSQCKLSFAVPDINTFTLHLNNYLENNSNTTFSDV